MGELVRHDEGEPASGADRCGVPIEKLSYNESQSTYVVLQKNNPAETLCTAKLDAKLCFNQLEDDDDIGRFVDYSSYSNPTPTPKSC